MFWDGTKWVDERTPASSTNRQPRPRRTRDLIATIPLILLLPALLLPFMAASAARPTITVTGSLIAGGRLAVTGRDFSPRDRLQLTWDGSAKGLPQVRVGSKGGFATRVTVPSATKAGPHDLAAVRLSTVSRTSSRISRQQARISRQQAVLSSTVGTPVVVADVTVTIAAPAAAGGPSPAPGDPTSQPDPSASVDPSSAPSVAPSTAPSSAPSVAPSTAPSSAPSIAPSTAPSSAPSVAPSVAPSTAPTPRPTPTPTPTPRPTPDPTPPPVVGDCGGSLQSKIDATGSGATLDLTGCSYAGSFLISRSMTLKGVDIDAPANESGLTITGDNVTIDHVTITGDQARTFKWGEKCIVGAGKSTNSLSGLVVKNSTISRCGYGGIYLHFASSASISSNKISDSVYAGVLLSSVSDSKVVSNTITGVGLTGTTPENNAYGITATQEDGPHSSDVLVQGNTISDIPTWHGLDTHGGVRITFKDNTIFHVRRAIFLTSSPTDAVVTGNDITAPTAAQQADCPSGAPATYCTDIRGISLFGGSATVDSNTGHGYPSGRWWNYGSGSYDAAGNSPGIS